MAIDTTVWGADAAAIASDIPATLVWGDQSIVGHSPNTGDTRNVEDIGVFREFDREWMGKLSLFTDSTPPTNSAVVSISNVNYYVDRREVGPSVVRLFLKRLT